MKIIVIGAGPSGLLCSYKLREQGHDVILIDKNEKVGKKIYITGKGRCNVTNNCTIEDFFNNIVTNNKFMFSAYSNFSSQDTIEFFESNNVELITERGNRVFPKSYQASDIAETLYKVNKNIGTIIKLNEIVQSMYKDNNSFVVKTNRNTYESDKVVIATGGKSYSHTGSTGDGYKFAKSFGHTIVDTVPGLCSIKIKENIPTSLYKFTLKNVSLKIATPNKKYEEFGELTFYKEGLAGPISLTLSSLINRINPEDISIEIDFKPALDNQKLEARLIREIQDKNNKNVGDLLRKLLPGDILEWFVKVANVNVESQLNSLPKEERTKIINNLKHFKLTYEGLDDIDHAVITSGGISVKEINPKTMESKIIEGLYFIGEVIDVDAFTGGFNMQIAFSTAALAASSINKLS